MICRGEHVNMKDRHRKRYYAIFFHLLPHYFKLVILTADSI